MIIDTKRGDIFESPYSNIIFAVNAEGVNNAGFAGQVAYRFWPELENIGAHELGTCLAHHGDDERTYHALVCHSLEQNGWAQAPEAITQALDACDLPEPSAMVLAGSGLVGRMQGADVYAILGGIARSKHKIVIYTR